MNQAELSKIFNRIINKVIDKRMSSIKTPEKGVDYFTRDEIDQIKSEIQASIPVIEAPKKGVDYFTNEEIQLIIATIIQMMPKAENGVTPKKGIDYFTEKEISKIVDTVRNSIKLPKDGKTPKKHIDYFTDEDVSFFLDIVESKIPKVKNGITPVKGDDYFTDEEIAEIIEQVQSKIAPTKQETLKPNEVRDLLEKLKDDQRLDAKYIKNIGNFISPHILTDTNRARVKVVDSDYTLLESDEIVLVNKAFTTMTLPSAFRRIGRKYTIDNASNGIVYITTVENQTIWDLVTQELPPQSSITVYSTNLNYRII